MGNLIYDLLTVGAFMWGWFFGQSSLRGALILNMISRIFLTFVGHWIYILDTFISLNIYASINIANCTV